MNRSANYRGSDDDFVICPECGEEFEKIESVRGLCQVCAWNSANNAMNYAEGEIWAREVLNAV